jgi:hypothetical protein
MGAGTQLGECVLYFPVQATKLRNAVMYAVDQSRTVRLQFRAADPPGEVRGIVPWEQRIEIVLLPNLKPGPELLLIAAVASPYLIQFFVKTESGGGA